MRQKQASTCVTLSLVLQLLEVGQYGSDQNVLDSVKSEQCDGLAVFSQYLSKLLPFYDS